MKTSLCTRAWGHSHGRDRPLHLLDCHRRRKSPKDRPRQPGAGMEPDLHRHADCDQYGKFVESTARRDRSHRDLRCLQRDRARYTPIFVDSTAPRGASRRAAVIAAAYTALVGVFPSLSPLQREALDARYAASLAALGDDGGDGGNRANAASPGEWRSRRPCSPGGRLTGSVPLLLLRSLEDWRSASGGRRAGHASR